jgi:hypothetical protein
MGQRKRLIGGEFVAAASSRGHELMERPLRSSILAFFGWWAAEKLDLI